MSWQDVDAGWGRCAPEAAYLFENMHWREYQHVLDQAGVTAGVRHLDIACGRGLAIQMASERGAMVSGLDASKRLVAIARTRTPTADIRIGDMFHLPLPGWHCFETGRRWRWNANRLRITGGLPSQCYRVCGSSGKSIQT